MVGEYVSRRESVGFSYTLRVFDPPISSSTSTPLKNAIAIGSASSSFAQKLVASELLGPIALPPLHWL